MNSGAGSATTATGGTTGTTSGGTGASTGGAIAVIPLAGSGQAVGGGDQGSLFPPDGAVPIMPLLRAGAVAAAWAAARAFPAMAR